jgi:endonuclease/exonuclease/phosphatase family metal-dependent hydrolase
MRARTSVQTSPQVQAGRGLAASAARTGRPDLAHPSGPDLRHETDRLSGLTCIHRLHQAQLAALTRIVRGVGVPAVVCGDFNVDRDSSPFAEFVAGTGLADAFEGSCPATFRAEYLPAGEVGHYIDFILTPAGVKAQDTGPLLVGQVELPGGPGYASDHIGLHADLLVAPS